MKKLKQQTIRIITVILVGMTITSIILMLVGGKGISEIISESFSLIVEVVALSIAIISQVDSAREEKRLRKIISDLRLVVEKDQTATASRKRLETKEDKLLKGQQEIVAKIEEARKEKCK